MSSNASEWPLRTKFSVNIAMFAFIFPEKSDLCGQAEELNTIVHMVHWWPCAWWWACAGNFWDLLRFSRGYWWCPPNPGLRAKICTCTSKNGLSTQTNQFSMVKTFIIILFLRNTFRVLSISSVFLKTINKFLPKLETPPVIAIIAYILRHLLHRKWSLFDDIILANIRIFISIEKNEILTYI